MGDTMQVALSYHKMPGVTQTIDLKAGEFTCVDGGRLIEVGDGTYTCLECGTNGYPVVPMT